MKRILPVIFVLAITLAGCNLARNTSGPTPTSAIASLVPLGTPTVQYGQEVARPLIRDFTNMGARLPGSAAEVQAAQYISTVFQAIGYTPSSVPFTADSGNGMVSSANVVAVKDGTSTQVLIVGAHYDSTGPGLGADNNASGVATMLEVARLVANQTTPYTIRFVAFGAAQSGLLGSYNYLDNMNQTDIENVVAMIDLDSLVAGDVPYVYSDEAPQAALRDWVLEWATGNGFDLKTIPNVDLTDPTTGKGLSDYAPFQNAGIPFVWFTASDWNLGDKNGLTQVDPNFGEKGVIRNTQYDTLAYLDSTFPGRVDQRLNLFISVLVHLLTQYEAPIQ